MLLHVVVRGRVVVITRQLLGPFTCMYVCLTQRISLGSSKYTNCDANPGITMYCVYPQRKVVNAVTPGHHNEVSPADCKLCTIYKKYSRLEHTILWVQASNSNLHFIVA